MKTAVIAITEEGRRVAERFLAVEGFHLYLPEKIAPRKDGVTGYSTSTAELVKRIWQNHRGFVFIMPAGAVVRLIRGLIRDKHIDPAVVVMDEMARYSISLLSGHEGGANGLAARASLICGAEPVITTGREAKKRLIVGMGCRRGVAVESLEEALREALSKVDKTIEEVRLIATIDAKRDEPSIHTLSERLDIPVVFIPKTLIASVEEGFERSEVAKKNMGVWSVAEPCAVLGGKRCTLILPKIKWKGLVTVAIAEESSMW